MDCVRLQTAVTRDVVGVFKLRMKALNMLLYENRLRLMVRREEHHRVVNDSDHAAKQEGLWGHALSGTSGSQLTVSVCCWECLRHY